MSEVITQVSEYERPDLNAAGFDESSSAGYNSKIRLSFRGVNFTITRDELMGLPESILLCLFPNGVFLDSSGHVISNLSEDDLVYVDFDPGCFKYIIDSFRDAETELKETKWNSHVDNLIPQTQEDAALTVLQNRPAIIVLREDLDYYVIPPVAGFDSDKIRFLKLEIAQALQSQKEIFKGLGYDTEVPESQQCLGPAEKHLFEMLCSSGFVATGKWGQRNLEPSKCIVESLSLVRLNSASNGTPPDSPGLDPVKSNASATSRKSRSRIASLASSASRAASRSLSRSKKVNSTQTKLLLFWRKPARKCWWSNSTFTIDCSSLNLEQKSYDVKVHIRRVWTLELSVIGVK